MSAVIIAKTVPRHNFCVIRAASGVLGVKPAHLQPADLIPTRPMLSSPPPEKHRPLVSRGLAIALIAISLVVVASAVYLRQHAASIDSQSRNTLSKPLPALLSPEQIAARRNQQLAEVQRRTRAFGLFIANGSIVTADGRERKQATLGRVVTAIRNLVVPEPRIVMLGGVDAVPLANINLNWPNPSVGQLEAVLKALAESTGGKFTLTLEQDDSVSHGFTINTHGAAARPADPSETGPTYLLAPPASPAPNASPRIAVFNLGGTVTESKEVTPTHTLEVRLLDARDKLAYLSAAYGPNWPDVSATETLIKTLELEIRQRKERSTAIQSRLTNIQSLIDETLLSLKLTDRPTLRFNQSTGLLIVTGSDAALEVAHKVILALGGRPTPDSEPSVPSTP